MHTTFKIIIFAILTIIIGCGDEGINIQDIHNPIAYANLTLIEQDEYDCPIEDYGDWTLLTKLNRNNFALDNFRVPEEEIDPITQAYADQKDFLFVIYEPAVIVDPRFNRGSDQAGGTTQQARYHLESPGLLQGDSLIAHFQIFHFVDPDAFWFQHYDQWRDLSKSGFTIAFDTTPYIDPEGSINPRKFQWSPLFGTSLNGWWPGGPGAPDINQDFVLNIYTR